MKYGSPGDEVPYTSEELSAFHERLEKLASDALERDDLSRCDPEIWKTFEPLTKGGRLIYSSFADEELLGHIHKAALRLERKPNRNEVYCVYARYLKRRFGGWPQALAIAGFRLEAGGILDGEIAERIRNLTDSRLKSIFYILCAREVPLHMPTQRNSKAAFKYVKAFFGTKNGAKRAIELFLEKEDSPSEGRQQVEIQQLSALKQKAAELGRTPLMLELRQDDAFCLWMHYGAWKKALHAAGLTPLAGKSLYQAGKDYMLAAVSAQFLRARFDDMLAQADLDAFQTVCNLARSLGRAPAKSELSDEILGKMNALCGSWRIVLKEMGLIPLDEKADIRASRAISSKSRTKK